MARQTTFPMPSVNELGTLPVCIPSLERQWLLVEFDQVICRAEQLEAEIQAKRRVLIENIFQLDF